MSLRLALVISGDAKGASSAVDKTISDVKRVNAETVKAVRASTDAQKRGHEESAASAKLSTQQLANMQFQLQDMAVMLASGQSPFVTITQQGSQIVQMFRPGTGVMAALRGFGQGVVSFITNPLNLATVGFGLALTAATSLFSYLASNSGTDILERHAELVKKIADEWDGARGNAKAYSIESRNSMLFDASQLTSKIEAKLRGEIDTLFMSGGNNINRDQVAGISRRSIAATGDQSLLQTVDSFMASIKAGTPDVLTFRDALSAIGRTTANDTVKQLVVHMMEQSRAAAEAQQEAVRNRDLVKGLSGDTEALNKALGKGSENLGNYARAIGKVDGAAFAAAQRSFGGAGPASLSQYAGKDLLDVLGLAEGTDKRRGYNETLGYGAFTGGPVDLVTKTLGEILVLQKQMLEHPDNGFNSSAVGRYQITRETLLDFMPKLGLDAKTIFSPDVQDKIALAIANAAGRDATALRGRWAGLKTIDEGVIKTAFDGSATARSSVAQSIAGLDRRGDKKADTEAAQEKKKLADQEQRWARLVAESAAAEVARSEAIGKSVREQAMLRREQELWSQARATFGDRLEKDKKLHDDVTSAIKAQAEAYGELAEKKMIDDKMSKGREMNERAQIQRWDDIRQIGRGITSTLFDSAEATKSWGGTWNAMIDSAKQKGLDFLDNVINNLLFGAEGSNGGGVLGSITGSLGNMFAGLFGGGTGGGLYAYGGAFGRGVQMFGTGGSFTNQIVSTPTMFGFGGKLGQMGEAGPEAIMPLLGGNRVRAMTPDGERGLPLARMNDGHLGVVLNDNRPKAFAKGGVFGTGGSTGSGGSDGGIVVNNNVTNYGQEKVTSTASRDQNGNVNIETIVGQAVNRHIATGGADDAMQGRFAGVSRRAEKNG